MFNILLQPLQFTFMQNAFFIAFLIAVPTALLSCFVVVRGWALLGDAISHATLPGIVIAYLLGAPLILGAFAAGVTAAFTTNYVVTHSRVKRETVLGIVFSGLFALGIVLNTAFPSDLHLSHILYGNLLGVEPYELRLSAGVAIVVTGLIAWLWRDLLLVSFDEAQARAAGLRVFWLDYGMQIAIALVIVSVLAAVGLILAVGLLIAPGAMAYLISRRFAAMMGWAFALCLGSLWLGIYLSFYFNSAPGPTVIVIQSIMFIALYIWRRLQSKRAHRDALQV